MKKIKVLQMPLRNNRGGIAKYILDNWRFIDKSQFTFDFITFADKIDYEDELLAEGCKIHYISNLPGKDEKKFYEEVHTILNEGYDVMHLHTSRWTGLQLEEIAMARGVPNVIVHSHNTHIGEREDWADRYNAFTQRHEQLKTTFTNNWHDYATNLCACSHLAARWLYGDALADSTVHVLKNAIDTQNFKYNEKRREQYRQSMELNGKFVLGHVGRFDPQKNHDFLIRMFHEVTKQIPNAHLLLTGQGGLFDRMKVLADELGIANKIQFLGIRDDVEALMQAMDVFVLPSLYEGFPITLVEAQAMGLKCLVSDKITTEAKIVPNTQFLPLDAEVWCAELTKIQAQGYTRKDTSHLVKDAGYDIRESVKMVEKLYRGEFKVDKQDEKIVLFGAGVRGRRMFEELVNNKITPAYFVDNKINEDKVSISVTGGGAIFF